MDRLDGVRRELLVYPTPAAMYRCFRVGDYDDQRQALASAYDLVPESSLCRTCKRKAHFSCDAHRVQYREYMCEGCTYVDPSGCGMYCEPCVKRLSLPALQKMVAAFQHAEEASAAGQPLQPTSIMNLIISDSPQIITCTTPVLP